MFPRNNKTNKAHWDEPWMARSRGHLPLFFFQEKRFNSGGCSIAYAFEARLHRPGFLKSDSKATSGLKVLRRPQETAAPAPVLVGPENQTVRTCCCFDSGRSVAAMAIVYF